MLKTGYSKSLVAASAVLLLAGLGAAGVEAQGRWAMRGRAFSQARALQAPGLARLGLAVRALDLTEPQREQVRTILEQHRDETRAVAEKARAARERMRRAESAATLDEAELRAAAASLADAQVEGAVLRAKVRGEVLAVLTPEQRQKAEQMRARAQERMRERAERIKARQAAPRVR
jgi:Spy/CpxP family protein refolding chaperone